MYDDIELRMDLNTSPYPRNGKYKSFKYRGIKFTPISNKYGTVTKFRGWAKNMVLEIEPQALIIKNSIHKYIMGNNFSDFTLSDVSSTAGMFLKDYDLDIRNAEVKKLSYAVNISIKDPDAVYKGFTSYQTRPFDRMRSKSKIYGSSYSGTEFKIKCYNKTWEARYHNFYYTKSGKILPYDKKDVPTNILRFETEIKNPRHLHKRKNPIPVYKFRDLYNYDNAVNILDDLRVKFESIYKNPNISDMNLSIKDLRLLAVFANPEYLEVYKTRHYETYRKDRAKIKRILEGNTGLERYDEVEEKLISKCQELLSR